MKARRLAANLAYGLSGAFLLALGVVVFLSPNHIVTGGPPGIAIILFHSLGISKALTLIAVNAVLVALGARLLGAGYLLRTCFAILSTAFFMELLAWLLPRPAVTSAPLLNTLYGGILVGTGLALVFKGEAAAGGWSLLARLLAERFGVGVGQCIVGLDLLVIAASALVFGEVEAALWAGIGVYVSGSLVNLVLTGRSETKLVHVSTTRPAELLAVLRERLRESGGDFHCDILPAGDGRQLMVLVLETAQIGQLNQILREVDGRAHVVVMDAVQFFSGVSAISRKNVFR